MVEPTNICNLKCPMCPSGNGEMKRRMGQLTFENFKKLLDDLGDYLIQVQLWNQGEPFLNKSFLDFVRYANKKGIMTHTSTNGHFIRTDEDAENLVKSGLDQLIFSMDGTNQESYEQYRVGGDYQLVMDTLKRITRAKHRLKSDKPLVELQFLVFKHNKDEIDQLITMSKRLELNRISFKTAQIYSNQQGEAFLPEDIAFSRYKHDGENYTLKGDIKNWCKRLWLNPAVNWDGTVSPCCFDKDAEHAFANYFSDSVKFKNIWKNGKYKAFRKRIMSDRKSIDMCANCSEGLPDPYTRIIEVSDL
jgi:radical SAM protein with 4Fe4S-binding SPASM domain